MILSLPENGDVWHRSPLPGRSIESSRRIHRIKPSHQAHQAIAADHYWSALWRNWQAIDDF
jgi:hypothetical protein